MGGRQFSRQFCSDEVARRERGWAVASDDRDQARVFDRYYFPTGDGKAVYVDTVADGIERARREAEKRVAAKRKWCKKRGVKYLVVVEETVTV